LRGCTGLTALPDNLHVEGWLDLRGCTGLTALPDNLHVKGGLGLRGNRERLLCRIPKKFYERLYWGSVGPIPAAAIAAPETLTKEQILQEKNVEVRRVMFERIGYDKFVELMDGTVIGTLDVDNGTELLYEVGVPGDPRSWKIVELVCPSSGRRYFHRVTRSAKTVTEAIASMWGLNADQWKLKQTA